MEKTDMFAVHDIVTGIPYEDHITEILFRRSMTYDVGIAKTTMLLAGEACTLSVEKDVLGYLETYHKVGDDGRMLYLSWEPWDGVEPVKALKIITATLLRVFEISEALPEKYGVTFIPPEMFRSIYLKHTVFKVPYGLAITAEEGRPVTQYTLTMKDCGSAGKNDSYANILMNTVLREVEGFIDIKVVRFEDSGLYGFTLSYNRFRPFFVEGILLSLDRIRGALFESENGMLLVKDTRDKVVIYAADGRVLPYDKSLKCAYDRLEWCRRTV